MTDRTEALDIEAIERDRIEAAIPFTCPACARPYNNPGEIHDQDRGTYRDCEHACHFARAALDRLIQALKTSNEERERVRAVFERIANMKVVHTDVGELNTYTLVEVKRMAEAALSTPEQPVADPEKVE